MEEIKPCPWCGKIPKIYKNRNKFINSNPPHEVWFGKCINDSCKIRPYTLVYYKTEQEAIKAWNTREGKSK